MSFILDALRKAEADRDRGRMPDVSTSSLAVPPQVGPGSQVRAAARSGRVWVWGALVLACVAGGVMGAWWMRGVSADGQGAPGGEGRQGAPGERLPRHSVPRNDVTPPELRMPRNDVTPPELQVARNAVNSPDQPVPRNDAQAPKVPGVPDASRPSLRGLNDQSPSLRGTNDQSSSSRVPNDQSPSLRGPSDQGTSLRGPNGPKQSPSAPAKPLPHTQLPTDAQRALSTLQFNGLMHSEQRSARMLIVNGQVLREGDVLTAGIRILEIKPRALVLRAQDLTYEWPLPSP